jgi:hypothetical protein
MSRYITLTNYYTGAPAIINLSDIVEIADCKSFGTCVRVKDRSVFVGEPALMVYRMWHGR